MSFLVNTRLIARRVISISGLDTSINRSKSCQKVLCSIIPSSSRFKSTTNSLVTEFNSNSDVKLAKANVQTSDAKVPTIGSANNLMTRICIPSMQNLRSSSPIVSLLLKDTESTATEITCTPQGQGNSSRKRFLPNGPGVNPLSFSSLFLSQANPTSLSFVPFMELKRNITKYSLRKGRRKTSNGVKKRFFRLDWGAWISPQPGRARHLWKKSVQHRSYLKNHIFRSGKEGKMLDKMVTKYWIKKKYFVDDPYENYHNRDNFWISKGVNGVKSTNLHPNSKSLNYTLRR